MCATLPSARLRLAMLPKGSLSLVQAEFVAKMYQRRPENSDKRYRMTPKENSGNPAPVLDFPRSARAAEAMRVSVAPMMDKSET